MWKVYDLGFYGLCFRDFVDRQQISAAVQLINMWIRVQIAFICKCVHIFTSTGRHEDVSR